MCRECGNCGEELLGSVNRCWKCGDLFVSHGSTPPKPEEPKRTPDEPVVVAATPADGEPTSVDEAEPFVEAIIVESPELPTQQNRPLAAPYSPDQRPSMAALAGLALGLGSFLGSWLTGWMLLPALFGMIFSVVGLGSGQRKLAAFGAAFSLLALAIATYVTIVAIFYNWYGYYPLEPLFEPSEPSGES